MSANPRTPYLWDNHKPAAVQRLDALSQMYDPFSQQRLRDTGIPQDGRCLEICAGDRAMAGWLAEQAGPAGSVLATDIDPQHITPHPRLTVLAHNLLTDALPDGPFDVIHARGVIQHMPDPQQLVNDLVAALAPGGILALEDVVPDWANAVLDSPDPCARDIFESFGFAWANLLRRTGDHGSWIGRAHQAMMRHGLAEVTTVGFQQSSPGGTGTCLLVDATASEHRDSLFDAGMRATDLDLLNALARDPRLSA
jgi:SAM-dependent methyltransferase